MADLRARFENTVLAIHDQSFEERWARYWAMVLHALDSAPDTLEFLNRLIIDQEEELAAAEGRPTLAQALGPERAQLRKEADDEVTQLLKPFFSGDGTTAEREAVANERRRIRSEIHPHTERAEPADAYETYALVLDYTTAFGVASAVAFKASVGMRQPARAERPDQAGQRSGHPQADAQAPQAERNGHGDPDRPEPAGQPPDLSHHAPAIEPPSAGPAIDPQRVGAAVPPPHHPSPNPDAQGGGGRRGVVIAAAIFLCLSVAAGAGYILKPEAFDPSFWSGSDRPTDPVTANPVQKPDAPAVTENKPEEPDLPPSPLDKFHTEIMNASLSKCAAPEDMANTKWADISTFTDCVKEEGVGLVNTFRFMLSQAGGQWLGGGNWKAPSGPTGKRLTEAWTHITGLRSRWGAQVRSAVSDYGASYFGFRSHGMTGWRFAAWRCRCNLKGEYQPGDTKNVKPRIFLTRPALIESEEEARLAFSQVGNYFVGPSAQGVKQAVEQGLKKANLPYGLPGGLGMARPLQTKEEADKAWAEVKALHAAVGFEVSELQWASN